MILEFNANLFVQAYCQKWQVLCSPNSVDWLGLVQLHLVSYFLEVAALAGPICSPNFVGGLRLDQLHFVRYFN